VAHLARHPCFRLEEHDVARAFDAEVDAVYHLALPSTPARYGLDEVKGAMTCVAGTKHVLDVAARRQARVVMASSTARFGEGLRCAEAIARATARDRAIDVRFVRVPEAYGPRVAPDDGQLVTRLVLDGLAGRAIEAPEGTVVRLAWALDVVETLVRVMAAPGRMPPVIAPFVHVTVVAIAEAVAEATGAPLARVAATEEPLPSVRQATISEAFPASLVLGLEPSVELASGIAEVARAIAARLGRDAIAPRTSAIYATKTIGRAS
jgi:nucleoside-diphosphate-sugar epimerase